MTKLFRFAPAVAALVLSTAASAEGYNLTQLLGGDFDVVAVVPGANPTRAGESRRFETLYLQGRLASGGQEILVRCIARAAPEEGEPNCQQVY